MNETFAPTAPMALLRQKFIERAGRDAGVLEAALEGFVLEADPLHAVRLRDKAHALIGGLATFGYAQASAEAEAFRALLGEAPVDRQSIDRCGRALCATLRSLSAGSQG